MSEGQGTVMNWELILGIVGTLTGSLSLLLYIMEYLQRRPKLALFIDESIRGSEYGMERPMPGPSQRAAYYDYVDVSGSVANDGNKTTSIRKVELVPTRPHSGSAVLTPSKFEVIHLEPGKSFNFKYSFYPPFLAFAADEYEIVLTDTRNKTVKAIITPKRAMEVRLRLLE